MDEDTLTEARESFKAISEAEQKNRNNWVSDVRFARLGEQWPAAVKNQREKDGRPCLTINRLPAFIRQVTNDARMNKPAISCHPVADGANKETAEILNGLIRNIEYTSNADVAYDTALEHAVTGGFGYLRVATDYAHDDTFDQDLKIERIANPLSVYGDHRSIGADSADWNVAFVTEQYTEDEFEEKWKNAEVKSFDADVKNQAPLWFLEDTIMVAEYWTREEKPSMLVKLNDGVVMRKDQYESMKDVLDGIGITVTGERPTKTMEVTQRIISGAEVLETNKWAGRYIPIVPVYGDEVIVEDERTWLSLIRFSKDAQQMLNYWRTASTELVALAPKAPWVGPRGSFNSSADKWNTANTVNHSYLEYDGPISPERQGFVGPPAGALQEAMNASDDMKAIMGLFDASLGNRSNETSGVAINARKAQGNTTTFNFVDNLSRAIRHTGRVLVDMIPHVYNTERVIRIIHKDGDNEEVPVNQPIQVQPGQPMPGQKTPAQQEQSEFTEGLVRMYDLTAGKYDVTCDSGPNYQTQREESASSMMQFIQAYPAAAPLIGDLIATNLDWQGADEIADRLKQMLPPQVNGQNPQVQQLNQQMQQMDAHAKDAVRQLKAQLDDKQFERSMEERKAQIDEYNAETQRIKALTEARSKAIDGQIEAAQAVQEMALMQNPQGMPHGMPQGVPPPPQQMPQQMQAPPGAFSLPQRLPPGVQ